MSRLLRHIKSQSNITYEEPYAITKPTDATFIAKETMETNTEEECLRQESGDVYYESKLVENKETKG